MLLEPRKTKYRKLHKPKVKTRSIEQKVVGPFYGVYGLKILESGRLTARELESARRIIAKRMKKKGQVWVSVFPDKSVTKKPAEVRMGKGKGAVDHWVTLVKAGRIIFEISGEGITKSTAEVIFKLAGQRLSLKNRMVIAKE